MRRKGTYNSMTIARKKINMTQAEVADKLGIDTSTVAKWETGVAYPRASMLLKLARLYECTIEDLIGEVA